MSGVWKEVHGSMGPDKLRVEKSFGIIVMVLRLLALGVDAYELDELWTEIKCGDKNVWL